jgi:hypothetical protein
MKSYIANVEAFNKAQQNYDNKENEAFDLCYQSQEETDKEKEVKFFENILTKDAQEYGDESLFAFLDYCHFVQTEGVSEDLLECLTTMIAEAASNDDEHDPLKIFVSSALHWKAEKLAL